MEPPADPVSRENRRPGVPTGDTAPPASTAETASATILVTAAHFGMPVSTTHSISTAIMGVGFAKNPRALKLTVIERIIWAWILTIPAAGGAAYGIYRLFELFGWA